MGHRGPVPRPAPTRRARGAEARARAPEAHPGSAAAAGRSPAPHIELSQRQIGFLLPNRQGGLKQRRGHFSVNKSWASLQRLFADTGAIAVDRALAELRA